MSKIGIIGNGFVGSAISYGFSLYVDEVKIYDTDPRRSTHSLEDIASDCGIIFVCVPTPMFESGECDLSIVHSVIDNLSICQGITDSIIAIKSTVVPGTLESLVKRYPNLNFVFNPEFLTERTAKLDFINTARIVIGSNKAKNNDVVESLYRIRFPHTQIIKTDLATAQLIKYMANCFFSTKVSFMNEMYQICEAVGANWQEAVNGFLSDGRIGNSHIDVPGHDKDFGFGGKCFPKDLNAMIMRSTELGIKPTVMKAVWEKNKEVRTNLNWYDIEGAVTQKKTKKDN